MNILKEPPPQTTSPTREGNDWLYRWSQAVSSFISNLSTSSGGGSHVTGVTSVTSPDVALSVAPTTGAVIASTNDFVGDAGSGGLHGVVPAPGPGDTAAGKFLKADATWEVPPGAGGGTVTEVDTAAPITGGPITGTGTIGINDFGGDAGSGGSNGAVPAPAAGDAAAGKFLKASGSWAVPPSGTGTVTSVALTAPAEFSVSGSPVTTSGTLAITKATETANTVWAGPTSGGAAQPTFRALVSGDLPAGTGTVTSVALTVPAEFSVSGSPVTTSGTMAVTKANESANTVWAGPTSGGAAAPTFRALVNADVPAGGSTTQLQFNSSNLLAGDSRLVFDSTNKVAKGQFSSDTSAVNAQTGTTYTLAATDNGGVVTFNNASAITVTLPSGLGKGFTVVCIQIGAGTVTFTTSGTTLTSFGGATGTAGQYAMVTLIADVADTFRLGGATA